MRGPRTAMKSGPRSPQLEKAHAQKRRPNTDKKINKLKLKSPFVDSDLEVSLATKKFKRKGTATYKAFITAHFNFKIFKNALKIS